MVIVFSKNSKIKWYFRTDDFKYRYLPKYGSVVPKTSAAGEFFYENIIYDSEEIIFPDDWFTDYKMNKNEELYEKCYYLPNNTVMSLIWKKESG